MQRCESRSHGTGRQVQVNFSFVQAACAIIIGQCFVPAKIQDHPHVRTRLGKDMTVTSITITLAYPGHLDIGRNMYCLTSQCAHRIVEAEAQQIGLIAISTSLPSLGLALPQRLSQNAATVVPCLTVSGWAFLKVGGAHFAGFLANVRPNFDPPGKAAGALQL